MPNDVATELQSCGNTAFREGEISIDAMPAGVAPVSPWSYTGGLDPLLWAPIPGVQTLNYVPYRLDGFDAVRGGAEPRAAAYRGTERVQR